MLLIFYTFLCIFAQKYFFLSMRVTGIWQNAKIKLSATLRFPNLLMLAFNNLKEERNYGFNKGLLSDTLNYY